MWRPRWPIFACRSAPSFRVEQATWQPSAAGTLDSRVDLVTPQHKHILARPNYGTPLGDFATSRALVACNRSEHRPAPDVETVLLRFVARPTAAPPIHAKADVIDASDEALLGPFMFSVRLRGTSGGSARKGDRILGVADDPSERLSRCCPVGVPI